MTGKHTPGPWRNMTNQVETMPDKGGAVICEVFALEGEDRHALGVEADANARLIAAAPELLDVCEIALGVFAWARDHGAQNIEPIADMARAAIAKATGGTA